MTTEEYVYRQNAREIIAASSPAPTVLDIVSAASALARSNGEEAPITTPTIAAPTMAETHAHRTANGNGWNDNRPLSAIDVIRTASANASGEA